MLVILIAGIAVIICDILHYEALRFLSRTVGVHIHKCIGVLVVMLGLLFAHVAEIIVFALTYRAMQHSAVLGYIAGLNDNKLLDFIYYSSIVIPRSGLKT